jgi:hypothetical protein
MLSLGAATCALNPPPAVQSADDICAALPDTGFGEAFFVGTTLSIYQVNPPLTSAGYTGFCMYADDTANPALALSGYIALDDTHYALFGGVSDSSGADHQCQLIQQSGDSCTIVHATRA